MQPHDDAADYLAHIVTLRAEVNGLLGVPARMLEDTATTDLGGSQQLMRTSLPPSPPPTRHKHPLDGAHGLGDATHDAEDAHAAEQTKRAANKHHQRDNDQDSDSDASDGDESSDDDAKDDPEDDDEDAD